jgi:AcrR family transcriptional regulator
MLAMSTSSYHHGDLRRALVEAAAGLMEEKGHEALSLREAARQAGVSHNAPYRHFADREALLDAVAAKGFQELAEAMVAARAREGFRGVGEAYVAFALAHPRLFQLMYSGPKGREPSDELADAMKLSEAPLKAAFEGLEGDPHATMVAAWSVVHGLAHLLIDHRLGKLAGGMSAPDLTRAVLTVAARGLMAEFRKG